VTPDAAARLVMRWVRAYTRGLPARVAQRRVEEIGSDLHDHFAHGRALGTSDRRVAVEVLWRMVRGMSADLVWRRQHRPVRGDLMKPYVAILGAALLFAALALAFDSPILVMIAVALVVADGIGVFLVGARAAQQGSFLVPFLATLTGAMLLAALAVGAIIVGDRGDAPGLTLLGVVVISCIIVGAFSLGARMARGRG
jgi:hypothetical protein